MVVVVIIIVVVVIIVFVVAIDVIRWCFLFVVAVVFVCCYAIR